MKTSMAHIRKPENQYTWTMAASGLTDLGEKGSSDEDLHSCGDEELEDEEDYGRCTLLCDTAVTIANGGL